MRQSTVIQQPADWRAILRQRDEARAVRRVAALTRQQPSMVVPYLLLAIAFALAVAGMAFGAAMNDKALMLIGGIPGIAGIVGLCCLFGAD